MSGRCWCCRGIVGRRDTQAVAIWTHGLSRNSTPVCQSCLDFWFDNADDDPDLEPREVHWLDGSRTLAGAR